MPAHVCFLDLHLVCIIHNYKLQAMCLVLWLPQTRSQLQVCFFKDSNSSSVSQIEYKASIIVQDTAS